MSVGVQNLSRRTRTLHPERVENEVDLSENDNNIRTQKFIDFKPIIISNPIENGSLNSDVDKLDKIAHTRKYNNYSVTGIKELPLSSGLTEDERDADSESDIKVNGETSDVDHSDSSVSIQLGTKERELQVALQKQERYQSTVQDVTARMERVQHRLASLGTTPFKNLDQQLAEQKVCLICIIYATWDDHFKMSKV